MNKSLSTVLLLLGLSLVAPSCQQGDQPISTQSEKQETKVLTLSGELEEIQGDNARAMQLVAQSQSGTGFTGLRFVWQEGDTEPVFLLFTEGNRREVVEAVLTIERHEPDRQRYKVKISAQPPAGMDPASGQITVTGAIGVSALDNNGQAVIPERSYFVDGNKSYCVPMYFAPATISPTRDEQGQTRYRAEISMKFFGSIIGIPLDNRSGNMSYQPREVVFTTDAFRTSGKMNLLTRDANDIPSFTPDAPRNNNQYVALDDVVALPRGQYRYDYFWIYPQTYSASSSDVTRPLTIAYHSGRSDAVTGDSEVDVVRNLHMAQLPLHRVKHAPLQQAIRAPLGGLIITEVFMGASPADFAWEFYNSSEVNVNLAAYNFFREDSNGNTYTTPLNDILTHAYNPTNPAVYVNKATQYRVNNLVLPPKKSAVFFSTAVRAGNEYNHANKPGLMYLVNLAHNVSPTSDYVDAFRVGQGSRYALKRRGNGAKASSAKNEDVFFWFPDGEARGTYPTATFMRKPGHDVPREYMQVKSNSDWVMRQRYEGVDWGYRFGYYNDGGTTRYLGTGNDMLNSRPLFDPDYSSGSLDFGQVVSQSRTRRYTPPASWTREAARAADGQ